MRSGSTSAADPKPANSHVLDGALQGTGEDAGKGESPQPLAELACVLLPAFVQRQVGSAGVPLGVGPDRVAVPDKIKSFGKSDDIDYLVRRCRPRCRWRAAYQSSPAAPIANR